MPLLDPQTASQVRQELAGLTGRVRILNFTQNFECQYCLETRQIAEEVAALSDKVEVEVYNFVTDQDQVQAYDIDKIPALVILGESDGQFKDYGIRFYGIPSGYEFTSFLDALKSVSQGEVDLMPQTRQFLSQLTVPLHIQVFVTPTCPYCPRAVMLAHHLAIASDLVRGDMVEVIEFPHLAQKYQVMGVPRIVINETVHQEGAVPEPYLLARLQEAVLRAEGKV